MKIKRQILSVIIFSLWSFLLCAEEFREWTTVSGKTIQASFEKRNGDILHLRAAPDHTPITVKYWDLWMADRKYVDDLLKSKKASARTNHALGLPNNAAPNPLRPGDDQIELTGDKIVWHDDRGTTVRTLAPNEEVLGLPYMVDGPNGTVRFAVNIVTLSPEELAARQKPSRKDIKFQRKVQRIFSQQQQSIEDQVRQGGLSEEQARSEWVQSHELMGHAVADHEGWSSSERLSRPATPDLPGFPTGVSSRKSIFANDDADSNKGRSKLGVRSFGDD